MMNLFGKAKAVKTSPKDAIVRLRESLDMLEKRERFLSTKIDAELKVAKLNAAKNKRGACLSVCVCVCKRGRAALMSAAVGRCLSPTHPHTHARTHTHSGPDGAEAEKGVRGPNSQDHGEQDDAGDAGDGH